MGWGYGGSWCRVVWEVVVREVGLGVEVSITRGSACEGSACPSAEASRSETAPAEGAELFSCF